MPVGDGEGLQLPEADGVTGTVRYSVSSNLPAGLTFDSATRTIMGTPTEEVEATEIIYTVLDNGKNAATLFTIEISVRSRLPRL